MTESYEPKVSDKASPWRRLAVVLCAQLWVALVFVAVDPLHPGAWVGSGLVGLIGLPWIVEAEG